MADNQGKEWVFWIVGTLMVLAIFGVPLGDMFSDKIGLDLGSFSEGISEYVFGINDSIDFGGANLTPYATIVIFLMIWLIVFVTFGDIMEAFSTFSSGISWIIAACLAVVGGMTGVYGGAVGAVTRWFTSFGVWAVYIGLAFSFVMFILVEIGLGAFLPKFKEFAIKRKSLQEEVGVKGKFMKAGAAIKHLNELEDTIEKA